MPEIFAHMPVAGPGVPDTLTTAPGDLPLSEIVARIAMQRSQFRHDNTIVPLAPRPGQTVEIWATSGEDLPIEHAALFYTIDGRFPDATASALPMQRVRVDWDVRAGYLTRWCAMLPAQPAQAIVRYRIGGWLAEYAGNNESTPAVWAQDGQGMWFRRTGVESITTFAFSVEEPAFPAWVRDAVIYHLFVDRFRTSAQDGAFPTDRLPQALHGGTLQGVSAALPYLADLGVTCLWLSPLTTAETYHRYDVTNYYHVDPRVGTDEDLKTLVDQAHALGMRVLLDFVPSHLSWHHPAFLAAQADRQAPSFDWFTFDHWPERYRCFLDTVPSLPSLRTQSEGARAHIIGSALQWIRDYGVDGFRLDHAIGQGMDFWTAFRQATRSISPDVFAVGEVTDSPDALVRYQGKLDSILDFPLASALRQTFGTENWDVCKFDHFLSVYERHMESGPERVSFLDNHDMERFLFVADNVIERLKMAALCQFTLAPTPTIYYGTEIGLSQQRTFADAGYGGDVQARGDMPWEQSRWNHDLLSFYRALISLRRNTVALRQGQRRTLHLSREQQTYAYVRTESTGCEPVAGDVLVLFNLSNGSQQIALPLTCELDSAQLLQTTEAIPVVRKDGHTLEVLLPPLSGAAFPVLPSAQEEKR